ncbi:hypothetical protein ASL14_20990 [Paenibacillus sp. IHB B 3084]|nr:hypothetical protein ASL14_20990 [Paenibacillus sp. IHB B 3084]
MIRGLIVFLLAAILSVQSVYAEPVVNTQRAAAGADIRYISPSDNRGAGSWVSHQLEESPDGTRVKFIVN